MSVITNYRAGMFCWAELCSAESAASKKFYSSLFGWASNDLHMPEGDYTMFKLSGDNVGAMYQMTPERKKAGVLPHWNLYVAVGNASETAKKAADLGGRVLTEPFDGGGDLMANLQDSTGAKFCIVEARKKQEPTRLNEIGALCWSELYTPDTAKSSQFYTELFGWRATAWEGGHVPYTMFSVAGVEMPFGGMLKITEEMKGVLTNWLPYFQVADADKTADLASKLGGQVHCAPMDIPTVGRMAMLFDPQGAGFAVIRLGAA